MSDKDAVISLATPANIPPTTATSPAYYSFQITVTDGNPAISGIPGQNNSDTATVIVVITSTGDLTFNNPPYEYQISSQNPNPFLVPLGGPLTDSRPNKWQLDATATNGQPVTYGVLAPPFGSADYRSNIEVTANGKASYTPSGLIRDTHEVDIFARDSEGNVALETATIPIDGFENFTLYANEDAAGNVVDANPIDPNDARQAGPPNCWLIGMLVHVAQNNTHDHMNDRCSRRRALLRSLLRSRNSWRSVESCLDKRGIG